MVHITKFVLTMAALVLMMAIYYTACNQPIELQQSEQIETQPEEIETTTEPDYTEPLHEDTFVNMGYFVDFNKEDQTIIVHDYLAIIADEDDGFLRLNIELNKQKILPQDIDSIKNMLTRHSKMLYEDFKLFLIK